MKTLNPYIFILYIVLANGKFEALNLIIAE